MDTENAKRQVEVIINSKVYRLSTTDSEEYIKSVAEYVNRKYTEIVNEVSSITRLSEHFPVLLALNIADDLFKQSAEGGKGLKEKSDLENKIYKLTQDIEEAESRISEKEKALSEKEEELQAAELKAEALKADSEALKAVIKEKEEAEASLKAETEETLKTLEALREENKRFSDIITDAGLIPPVPDKNGKIKDKDKARETLLKELNDIKSENGRTKKENKILSEKLKAAEEELALLKNAAAGLSETAAKSQITAKK